MNVATAKRPAAPGVGSAVPRLPVLGGVTEPEPCCVFGPVPGLRDDGRYEAEGVAVVDELADLALGGAALRVGGSLREEAEANAVAFDPD